jgi:acetyl esterase/lipase
MILSLLQALMAPIRSQARRGLSYGQKPHQTIEVHAPSGADGEAPVVVMFEPCDRRAGQLLASRGLVAAVVGADDWTEPGALADAASACAWVRAHAAEYGGDPGRLFVFGYGEGGWVIARLAFEPGWLAAVGLDGGLSGAIGSFGLYDLPGVKPTVVRPDAPPMLLLAGRGECGERDRSTMRLAQKLRLAGAQVAEILIPGLGPAPLIQRVLALRQRQMALEEIERFIRLRSLESAG